MKHAQKKDDKNAVYIVICHAGSKCNAANHLLKVIEYKI
jgi:hypothetical protein